MCGAVGLGTLSKLSAKVRKPSLHELLASNADHSMQWCYSIKGVIIYYLDSSCCIIVSSYLGLTTNFLEHISSLVQVF